MKIIKTTIALLAIFCSAQIFAQKTLTIEQTNKMADNAQLYEDNGDKAMMMFILTQNGNSYDQAITLYKNSIAAYDTVMTSGTASQNSAGSLAQWYTLSLTGVQDKMSMYQGFVHDEIAHETPKDRKKKVTYEEKDYTISSFDKTYYGMLKDDIEKSAKRQKK